MATQSCAEITSPESAATGSGFSSGTASSGSGRGTMGKPSRLRRSNSDSGIRHWPPGVVSALDHAVFAQQAHRGQTDPKLAGDLTGGIEERFHVSTIRKNAWLFNAFCVAWLVWEPFLRCLRVFRVVGALVSTF